MNEAEEQEAAIRWQIDLIYRQIIEPGFFDDAQWRHLTGGSPAALCTSASDDHESQTPHKDDTDRQPADICDSPEILSCAKSEQKQCLSNSYSGGRDFERACTSEIIEISSDDEDFSVSDNSLVDGGSLSAAESEGSNVSGYCPSRRSHVLKGNSKHQRIAKDHGKKSKKPVNKTKNNGNKTKKRSSKENRAYSSQGNTRKPVSRRKDRKSCGTTPGLQSKRVVSPEKKTTKLKRDRDMKKESSAVLRDERVDQRQIQYESHNNETSKRESERFSKKSSAENKDPSVSNNVHKTREKLPQKRKSSENIESTKRKVHIKTNSEDKNVASTSRNQQNCETETGDSFVTKDPLYCLSNMEARASQISLRDMEELMPLPSVSNRLTIASNTSNDLLTVQKFPFSKTHTSLFGPPRHVGAVWKSIVSEK